MRLLSLSFPSYPFSRAMDMPLEARSFFEHPDIVKTEDDLQRVSESARLAFALMEPWQQVRCK